MSQLIKRIVYAGTFIIVLLFGLILFSKNNQLLTFDYLVGNRELSLAWLLFLSLCLGVILGMLACLPMLVRLKRDKIKFKKLVKVTEKEVNNLRVMPMKDTN
jgi:putative membrane protein